MQTCSWAFKLVSYNYQRSRPPGDSLDLQEMFKIIFCTRQALDSREGGLDADERLRRQNPLRAGPRSALLF
jgi:hypothetical protein